MKPQRKVPESSTDQKLVFHRRMPWRAFAIGVIVLMPAWANAGHIELYEDTSCRKFLAKITVDKPIDVRTGDHSDSKFGGNDKISSVRFTNVPVGTVLELWDHGDQRAKDDYCRITVLQMGTFQINHIEQNPGGTGLKYERFGKRDSRSSLGNLKGKVSHLVLRPGAGAPPANTGTRNAAYYKVGVKTSDFDGTTNDCYIRLYGDQAANPSEWYQLKGKHGRGENYLSNPIAINMPFIGKVTKIDLRVQTKSSFQSRDAWTPELIVVKSPKTDTTDSSDPNGFFETKFSTLNVKIDEGYASLRSFTPQVSSLTGEIVKVGSPPSGFVTVTTVLGHLNGTNIEQAGAQLAESWSSSVSTGVATTKETSVGVEATLGFEQEVVSTTISASLTASMNQAWAREESSGVESGTGSEFAYNFNVPPNSIVFSKTVVSVPVKYTEYRSSKTPGARILTRTLSAQITSANLQVGETIELPTKATNPSDIRERETVDGFMSKWYPFMSANDKKLVNDNIAFWISTGALSRGTSTSQRPGMTPPIPTQPNVQGTPQPGPANGLNTLSGFWRDDWDKGTIEISAKGGGMLAVLKRENQPHGWRSCFFKRIADGKYEAKFYSDESGQNFLGNIGVLTAVVETVGGKKIIRFPNDFTWSQN